MSPYIAHNCAQCGSPVIRKGNETSKNYNKRECCSRQCAGLLRSGGVAYEVMRCQVCSIELVKGKQTSVPEYLKRKTCNSPECVSAWRSRHSASVLDFTPPLIEAALREWRA